MFYYGSSLHLLHLTPAPRAFMLCALVHSLSCGMHCRCNMVNTALLIFKIEPCLLNSVDYFFGIFSVIGDPGLLTKVTNDV